MYLQKAFECFPRRAREAGQPFSEQENESQYSQPLWLSEPARLEPQHESQLLWKTWLRQGREEGDQATVWDARDED